MVLQEQKNTTFGLTGFEGANLELLAEACPLIREELRESLAVLNGQGFCVCGQYPWDHWQRIALDRGVPEELATLGRSLMREASQHAWGERLRSLCGWNDEGRRMIALALRSPKTAKQRWSWLLETDGQRVDPATFEWIGEESWKWPSLRRRWNKEVCR